MTQVKIESSKVAAPDLSAHARSRAASLLGTDDFASMIDAPHNDAPTTPTHTETRPAKDSRPSERSSSHRTDSTVPSDRPPSRRSDRPEATPRVGDDSRPRAADRAADAADAGNASPPHKGADDGEDSDQRTGKTDRDGDPIAGTAVASATPPAPVVAPVAQPNTLAPDGAPADNATTIAAATATASASAQTSDADAIPANAEHAQAVDAGKSKSASLIAVPAQKKLGAEPAAEDGEVASPNPAEAGVGPAKTHVEGKIGKGSKIRAEGEASATTQAGEGTAPDGQQIQPPQPDASDVAGSSPTTEPSHKGVHAHLHGTAGTSSKKEHNDEAATARTDTLQIGVVQAAASPNNASATIGPEAGIAAAGSAVAGVAAVTTTTATSSPSGAASAPVALADLGVEIAAQAKAGRRSFDIRLDPPELGHIHVRLDVDRDGNVISRLIVDRADTLDLLRRDAPQLQRALQDAGLKADAQTMQFSLRDQNAGQQGGYNTPHSAARATNLDAGTRLDEVPLTYGRLPNRTGGLDIRI